MKKSQGSSPKFAKPSAPKKGQKPQKAQSQTKAAGPKNKFQAPLKRGPKPARDERAVEKKTSLARVEFVKSAKEVSGWPQDERPEIAITGRSNAGKSTFINALTNQKIAKVSNTPGKTILLNFFNIGQGYRLVDMPGYGYAARSGHEQVSWSDMIEPYLVLRTQLVGVILIVDIRRKWSDDEKLLVQFLEKHDRPWALVLSKTDKLNAKEMREARLRFAGVTSAQNIFYCSSQKRESVQQVEEALYSRWVKGSEAAVGVRQ